METLTLNEYVTLYNMLNSANVPVSEAEPALALRSKLIKSIEHLEKERQDADA